MLIQCDSCGKIWEYNGTKEVDSYVTCPNCYSKTKIPSYDLADIIRKVIEKYDSQMA